MRQIYKGEKRKMYLSYLLLLLGASYTAEAQDMGNVVAALLGPEKNKG